MQSCMLYLLLRTEKYDTYMYTVFSTPEFILLRLRVFSALHFFSFFFFFSCSGTCVQVLLSGVILVIVYILIGFDVSLIIDNYC